jgi:SsrA-binding protein
MTPFTENKRAHFDYEFLETYEAGLELTGHETKSIRVGHPNISGSHVIIRGGEAFITGMSIPSFQPGNEPDGYDADRIRRLLLTKKEIAELMTKTKAGLTIIGVKLYNKKRRIKILIALARGKKKSDKRESIKKRETDREIRRYEK